MTRISGTTTLLILLGTISLQLMCIVFVLLQISATLRGMLEVMS